MAEEEIKEEKKEKQKKGVTLKIPKNPWMIATVILVIILAIVLIGGSNITGKFLSSSISGDEAAKRTVDYINKNILQGQGNATISSVTESNGLYRFKLNIAGRDYDTYMTTDGKLLFPSVIDITATTQTTETTETTQPENFEPTKTDKPTVQLFVMSFCPYGIQAENAMKPVVDLLGDKAVFEPHFIVQVFSNDNELNDYVNELKKRDPSITLEQVKTNLLKITIGQNNAYISSLHGAYEAKEDMRQACIWKNYGQAIFWTYVDYINANCNKNNLDTCWKDAAKAAKIITSKIESCVTKEGLTLMKNEEALSNQNQVSGSPTLIINGALYNGGRTADAYKTAVCSAFKTAPSDCSTALSSNSSATATGGCG